MIYELRIYECVPGRLPDLNKRFSTITPEDLGETLASSRPVSGPR